jgi:hypothetical protein
LGTAAAVTATVLVNGAAVTQILLRRGSKRKPDGTAAAYAGRTDEDNRGEKGDQDDQDKEVKYYLDIRTENQRTQLATDGKDQLWIFGQVQCTDPEVDAGSLTGALSFIAGGPDSAWLVLGPPTMTGGYKAVLVRAQQPAPEADLAEGSAFVRVGVTMEGKVVSGEVQLSLLPQLRLEIS